MASAALLVSSSRHNECIRGRQLAGGWSDRHQLLPPPCPGMCPTGQASQSALCCCRLDFYIDIARKTKAKVMIDPGNGHIASEISMIRHDRGQIDREVYSGWATAASLQQFILSNSADGWTGTLQLQCGGSPPASKLFSAVDRELIAEVTGAGMQLSTS